jgi:hypothetical protein
MAAPYLRLRQVCLAAPHLESAAALIADLLGLEECFRDPAVAAYGLENAVFPLGPDRFLEVVAPTAPGTAAGRFLERTQGEGGYMLIFDCEDPEPRVARAERLGVRLAHKADHDGFRMRQLHPRDCRACFLEFDHTEGGEAPDGPYHPAGPDWQRHVRTDVTRRLLSAEALSDDAPGLAAHWSALMDVPAEPRDGGARLTVEAQAIDLRPAPGLARERLDALVIEAADPAGMLARARATGLETRADAFRLCGVWVRPRAG